MQRLDLSGLLCSQQRSPGFSRNNPDVQLLCSKQKQQNRRHQWESESGARRPQAPRPEHLTSHKLCSCQLSCGQELLQRVLLGD